MTKPQRDTSQTFSSYSGISRTYRPQFFHQVTGQEAIVTTLKNALRLQKVAHAYLFCGSRGVGKTTLARLFAKALNCSQKREDFEPCNECSSCLEILSGQSLDVLEIDGASNRGIDDIRQINETVGYAPSSGQYKIYIIDEVHMLTKEAFNALLKTLEEPPPRAKFFFATTEPHKVLPTIISRCQRFDLARLSPVQVTEKLQQIAVAVQREIDPEALSLIATFSEGSLRDAESCLDRIFCFTEERVTTQMVRDSLGLVPQELFFSLDEAFSQANFSYAFTLTHQIFQMGKDLSHFLEQLIEHYRNLLLYKTDPNPTLAPLYAASATFYTSTQCMSILQLLLERESAFQKSVFQRISLESLLMQILQIKNKIPLEVLVRRLSELENTWKAPLSSEQVSSQHPKIPLPTNAPKEPTPLPQAPPQQTQTSSLKQEIPSLKPVPFDPTNTPQEPTPLPQAPPQQTQNPPLKEEPSPLKPASFDPTSTAKTAESPPQMTPSPHPSHYDTLVRFAAVELEATIQTNPNTRS